MLSVLLDTHILLWWRTDPRRLSRRQVEALRELTERAESAAISAISLREIAHAVQRGRHEVDQPLHTWLQEMETDPQLEVLPLTAQIAVESVRLGDDFPKDPADQVIVATALCHGLRLMTADDRIRRWGKVRLI